MFCTNLKLWLPPTSSSPMTWAFLIRTEQLFDIMSFRNFIILSWKLCFFTFARIWGNYGVLSAHWGDIKFGKRVVWKVSPQNLRWLLSDSVNNLDCPVGRQLKMGMSSYSWNSPVIFNLHSWLKILPESITAVNVVIRLSYSTTKNVLFNLALLYQYWLRGSCFI
jgi:hypothetical protein